MLRIIRLVLSYYLLDVFSNMNQYTLPFVFTNIDT